MLEEHISRINELAKLARERELTREEQAERQSLREAYLANFRKNFRDQIEHTVVEYPDGSKVKLSEAYRKDQGN